MNPALFQATDWSNIPVKEYPGKTGKSFSRAAEYEHVRISLVDYSEHFSSHDWPHKKLVVCCTEGEVSFEFSDGSVITLSKGKTLQVQGRVSKYYTSTANGASLLIIDGNFLQPERHSFFNPWRI